MSFVKRKDNRVARASFNRRRKQQLLHYPLCAYCLENGKNIPATIADHVTPHRGDPNQFIRGELQSLCIQCHNARKQQLERRGYSNAVGEDGWPLDPNHPSNQIEQALKAPNIIRLRS